MCRFGTSRRRARWPERRMDAGDEHGKAGDCNNIDLILDDACSRLDKEQFLRPNHEGFKTSCRERERKCRPTAANNS